MLGGPDKDYAEAAKWLTRAAEQGEHSSYLPLGWLYEDGRGVPQSYAQAFKWYTRLAELGATDSQYNLAQMHLLGRGTPQDFIKAHAWYNLAARMTPDQVARAQELATELHKRIEFSKSE